LPNLYSGDEPPPVTVLYRHIHLLFKAQLLPSKKAVLIVENHFEVRLDFSTRTSLIQERTCSGARTAIDQSRIAHPFFGLIAFGLAGSWKPLKKSKMRATATSVKYHLLAALDVWA
jgi:hypothetical protein